MVDLTYFFANGKINRTKKRNESISRLNLNIDKYVQDISLDTPIESMATFVETKSRSISPVLLFSNDEYIDGMTATKNNTIFLATIYGNNDVTRVERIDLSNCMNKRNSIYLVSKKYFYHIFDHGNKILMVSEEEPEKIMTENLFCRVFYIQRITP